MTDSVERIHQLFEEACHTLFSELGCTALRVDTPLDTYELEDAPSALIDAGSNDIELNVILRFPTPLLALTYPASDGITQIDDATLEDWVSELANRLVGHLKRQLMDHGCPVMIGLPTYYHGSDLDEASIGDGQFEHYYFDIDQITGECAISTALFNPDLQLTEPADSGESADDDGGIEFF